MRFFAFAGRIKKSAAPAQKGLIDSWGHALKWFSAKQPERSSLEAFKSKKLCGMPGNRKAWHCPSCEKPIANAKDTAPD